MEIFEKFSFYILIAIFAFIFVGIIYTLFTWKKAKSTTSDNEGVFFVFSLLGIIPLVFGVVLAARTIHLYVYGIEVSGKIEKIYFSRSASTKTRISHNTGLAIHSKSRPKKYALVSYKTQTGITEAEVVVSRTNSPKVGEDVKVIYLSTLPPRAAIKGYTDINHILFLPLVAIVVGSVFLSFGIVSWTQNKNTVLYMRLNSVGSIILLISFLSMFIIIPIWVLYKFVPSIPATYHWFYKTMRPVEETLYEPLLGPGVTTKKPPVGNPYTICPPMTLVNLSQTTASPGDVIELNGNWGEFTSNKVPRIGGHNDIRRLKVLNWTPNVIQVEIPKWLKPGEFSIDVICYTDLSLKSSLPNNSLKIKINMF